MVVVSVVVVTVSLRNLRIKHCTFCVGRYAATSCQIHGMTALRRLAEGIRCRPKPFAPVAFGANRFSQDWQRLLSESLTEMRHLEMHSPSEFRTFTVENWFHL